MTDTEPTTDDIQPQVASTYLALAELLSGRSDSAWDTPSLCEGWRAREVVAHVTMPSRYTQEEFMAELEANDFDFGRLSMAVATRDAELPTATLLADLRSDTLHHWTPPGGGSHGALNHAVIHALDIAVPLDSPEIIAPQAIALVLDDLTVGGVHTHFATSIDGRRLEATDIDWAHGAGDPLRGPAHQLALALCGRTLSRNDLAGSAISAEPRSDQR